MAEIEINKRGTLRSAKAELVVFLRDENYNSHEFYPTLIGKASDPSWSLVLTMVDNDLQSTNVIIADDSGKVRKFPTLDALVKAVAFVAEDGAGNYAFSQIATGEAFASKVPANIYADAESKKAKLVKIKAAQIVKKSSLTALIQSGGAMFGWDTGNAVQRARFAETEAQINTIAADVVALGGEIDRLQTVIESDPNYVAP